MEDGRNRADVRARHDVVPGQILVRAGVHAPVRQHRRGALRSTGRQRVGGPAGLHVWLAALQIIGVSGQ